MLLFRVENKGTASINKCACGMFLHRKLLFVIEGIIACLGWGKLFCAPLNGTEVAPQPNILPSLADFGY